MTLCEQSRHDFTFSLLMSNQIAIPLCLFFAYVLNVTPSLEMVLLKCAGVYVAEDLQCQT